MIIKTRSFCVKFVYSIFNLHIILLKFIFIFYRAIININFDLYNDVFVPLYLIFMNIFVYNKPYILSVPSCHSTMMRARSSSTLAETISSIPTKSSSTCWS